MNIQDLANAVADLKAEAINGKPITPELVAEIAEEYGNIHPARLAKCFIDSYPRPELLSDELQATSHKGWQALRAAEDFKNSLVAYDPWQRRYLEAKWRIYRVTVLGKSDCGRAFVVSQDDSRVLLVEPGELDFEAA